MKRLMRLLGIGRKEGQFRTIDGRAVFMGGPGSGGGSAGGGAPGPAAKPEVLPEPNIPRTDKGTLRISSALPQIKGTRVTNRVAEKISGLIDDRYIKADWPVVQDTVSGYLIVSPLKYLGLSPEHFNQETGMTSNGSFKLLGEAADVVDSILD